MDEEVTPTLPVPPGADLAATSARCWNGSPTQR